MMHDLYRKQLSDYVLGMLDSAEISALENHLLTCPDCRTALERERSIGSRVRGTLTAIPAPNHARMMRLMPPAPTAATRTAYGTPWQRAFAFVMAFVALITANIGMQFQDTFGPVTASPMPAYVLSTATATGAPTATATRLAYTTATPISTPEPVLNSR